MKTKNWCFYFLIFIFVFINSIFSQPINDKAYSGMKWRLIGPFRAGWGTVAEGIPDKPNTFYFGSAGGGVWKTIDAGRTWDPLIRMNQPLRSVHLQ